MTEREYEAVLESNRQKVERLVALHMDLQLRLRFKPRDVAQLTLVEAAHRRDELCADGRPVIVTLRELAFRRLSDLRTVHLSEGAESPACTLPISDYWLRLPLTHPGCPAGDAGNGRYAVKRRIRNAVEALAPKDRELLALIYCENLDTDEVAAILGLPPCEVHDRSRHALDRFLDAFRATELQACNGRQHDRT